MNNLLDSRSGGARAETKSSLGGRARLDLLISLFLVTLVLAAYGQTIGYGFVNYDDGEYVFENPHVFGGLTAPGLRRPAASPRPCNGRDRRWQKQSARMRKRGLLIRY